MDIGPVFGVSLQGGLSAWVWGLLRSSSIEGVPLPKFVGDAAWGMRGLGLWFSFFWFPCRGGVGCGGFMRGWCLQAFFCAYFSA